VIPLGSEVFVATEPVDMRYGIERLGGIVRERMQREPRTKKALFVFVGKRGTTLKMLWWDGTGTVLLSKRLDASTFELPKAREVGAASVVVSEAAFEALFNGLRTYAVH
jgi:transposase